MTVTPIETAITEPVATPTTEEKVMAETPADPVEEKPADGEATIYAATSAVLSEKALALVLTGKDAIDGTGNALDNEITGNLAANRLDGGAGIDTLAGGEGDDTYVVDDAGDLVIENAKEGNDTVEASVSWKLGADLEGLVLAGKDATDGIGNDLGNVITGNAAANRLDGGAGMDTLAGGEGDDTYVVDDAGDLVIENAKEGNDTVVASLSWKLGANIEALVLAGKDAIDGVGNDLDNVITGNAAANRLDGGAGADTLAGGAGDDTYVVDGAGDVVLENAGEGRDTVEASVAWTLGANVEALVLTGTGAIGGTGNALDNTLVGNAAANRLDGGAGADTMAGGEGNDTYVVDSLGDRVAEAAGEGTDTVEASVTWTLGDNVEALVLTGTGTIGGTGNALDNTLAGNGAANRLDGGAGADTMAGGLGNDTYVVDQARDVATEAAGAGADTVEAALDWTLGANLEGLVLTGAALDGTGNTLDNHILGTAATNRLTGLAGNDTLNGGAGADTLAGGIGNDTYVVDTLADLVVEAAGEGTDLVQSAVTWTLGDTVENLTLTGSAATSGFGHAGSNAITGNGGANRLEGFGGNDTLNGGGGADTLIGGIGNDTHVVDNVGDLAVELADEGTDLVQSSITWTLGATFENLTLTGSGAINGFGHAGANVIAGNTGANRLDGMGGADTLQGGGGNDTYVVNNAGVVLVEAANAGTDLVEASLTWTLAANIENLTLTGGAAIDGFGNTLNNVILGNAATNRMEGLAGNDTLNGGAGGDTMLGGAGNDLYVVDDIGDRPIETAAADGVDLVESSITWTLGAWLENLRLTGTAATLGFGNELDNIIWGNVAANRISGLAGNDTLDAGAGNDTLLGGNGADSMLGGAGDDSMAGDAGADTLDGGTGGDEMLGGDGDDLYLVDHWWDQAIESAPTGGIDHVISAVSFTLRDQVEHLTLTEAVNAYGGWGNWQDNRIIGNSRANLLDGHAGNDTLLGGAGLDTLQGGDGNDSLDGGLDADTMSGGAGNDTLRGGNGNDQLSGSTGDDTVLGEAGDDSAYGGWGNDSLGGEAGNDHLDGGAGADTVEGGAGNDTYAVDDAADVITERAGEGLSDLVLSSVAWTLGAEFEHLSLLGRAAVDGTGNGLANRIRGNVAANALDGGVGHDSVWGEAGDDRILGGEGADLLDGGAGADTLAGGAGNDTMVVDDARDVVLEDAGGGTDLVQSAVTWTLSAEIENLTLTGTAAVDGIGHAGANRITGNAAANRLDGGAGEDSLWGGAGDDNVAGGAGADHLDGGTGADSLVGGAGDDAYVVDQAGDVVTEAAGGGVDLVKASIGWTLGDEVENLTLLGTAAIGGTGNALGNVIKGNGAANLLRGEDGADALYGGAGNDTLDGGAGRDGMVGGAGNDVFIFRSVTDSPAGSTRDTIHDFAIGDRLDFSGIDADPSTLGREALGLSPAGGGGFVGWTVLGTGTLVEVRLAGDAAPDMAVFLVGWTGKLSADSFIL